MDSVSRPMTSLCIACSSATESSVSVTFAVVGSVVAVSR